MITAAFLKDMFERALKTFVYVFGGAYAPNFFGGGPGVADTSGLAAALGIASSATVLSVIGSFVSIGFGDVGTASMVKVQSGVQDWVTKQVLGVLSQNKLAVVAPVTPAAAATVAAAASTPDAGTTAAAVPKAARRRPTSAAKDGP